MNDELDLDRIVSSDLRTVPKDKQAQARAALALVAHRYAVVPVPGSVDGAQVRRPTPGGEVSYRAIAGGLYRAVVVAVRDGADLVDLDVFVPGCADPVRLGGVPFRRGAEMRR